MESVENESTEAALHAHDPAVADLLHVRLWRADAFQEESVGVELVPFRCTFTCFT